jgi:hypothetical protein
MSSAPGFLSRSSTLTKNLGKTSDGGNTPRLTPEYRAHGFPANSCCAVINKEILRWLVANWCNLESQASPSHRILAVTTGAVSQIERLTRVNSTSVPITRSVSWHADFTFQPVLSRSNRTATMTGAQAVRRATGGNLRHASTPAVRMEH